MAIATPIAAAIQGSILLNDFRQRHGDAPFPVSPSRGVVVAVHQDKSTTANTTAVAALGALVQTMAATTAALTERSPAEEPPLRILVIGDSLAAGVGVSQTGTPVLPESIARALSQRLGGRPVYWTCVGTPGASASRIVHDIESYQESLLVRQPTTAPELILTESWLKGIRKQWTSVHERKDRLQEWWKSRRSTEDENGDGKESTSSAIAQWWQHVRQDAHGFQQAWTSPIAIDTSIMDHDKGNASENEKSKDIVDPFQLWQRWRRRLQRRSSLRNPDIVGQFDVAIVLTGLNDLKEAILPFMMKGANKRLKEAESHEGEGLTSELERVLQALQRRMNLVLDRPPESEQLRDEAGYDAPNDHPEEALLNVIRENETRSNLRRHFSRRRPLVVFPALPVAPLPVFHSAPLSWFALPLIRRVDSYKREVARRFPGEVLFVEPPTLEVYSDIDQGKGPLWDERRTEQVLVQLTDVTQRARERVEALMKEHYEKWASRMGLHDESHQHYQTPEEVHNDSAIQQADLPGRSLISVDNVHPNDEGYEFWGRHIAAAIVEEWNIQDDQRREP
jgi:lysophospholipase L1-like esterase